MAVYNEKHERIRTGERVRNGLAGRTEGGWVLAGALILAAVLVIGGWLFMNRADNTGRTSAPASSGSSSAAHTASPPSNASKRP
jgi:hypothetical protein